MRNALFALGLLAGLSAAAQQADPPGPDPLRITVASGFAYRSASHVFRTASFTGNPVELRYGGAQPPPTFRVSGAWFLHKFVGVALDGSLELFSVGPADQALAALTRRVEKANTWSASVGAAGRWVPVSLVSLELHLGWLVRGNTIVATDNEGKLFGREAFHQGPYATLAVGVHPPAPVSFLAWARAAPFSAHTAGLERGTTSGFYSFGLDAVLGRLALLGLRWSAVLQYEANLRRTSLATPRAAVFFTFADTAHNFSLGLRAALPGPPVEQATRADTRPGSLLGTVLGSDGVPVWKAKVVAGNRPELETDAQGQFKLEALEPGPLSVSASALGFKPGAAEVTIAAGEQAATTITLQRPTGPGVLSGKVLLTDPERPAAGAEVAVTGGPTVKAGDDGSYKVEGIGPGPVRVKFQAVGYEPTTEVMQIPAEATATLDVKLSNKKPSALLRGKVSVKSGVLISATVTVKQNKLSVQVDADGNFSIELPGGRYDIVVESPGYRTQTRSLDVDYGDQTIYHFELRPSR